MALKAAIDTSMVLDSILGTAVAANFLVASPPVIVDMDGRGAYNSASNDGNLRFDFVSVPGKTITLQCNWFPGGFRVLELLLAGSTQCSVRWDAFSSQLVAHRGPADILGYSAVINPFAWHYIKLQCFVDNVVGRIIAYVDNETVPILDITGDFQFLGTSNVNDVRVYPRNGMSNIILMDETGATFNTFIPQNQCILIMPDGIGDSTQWVPTGNPANWACVDDPDFNADEDTSYVSGDAIGAVDFYNCQNLLLASDPLGVQLYSRFRKDEPGAREARAVAKFGPNITNGPTIAIPDGYGTFTLFMETAPGGAPWTEAIVNALQIGAEVIS